jgi:hypothetical protein
MDNFYIYLKGLNWSEILILKTGRAARASRNAKWISFIGSEFALVSRKCTKNCHRIGR